MHAKCACSNSEYCCWISINLFPHFCAELAVTVACGYDKGKGFFLDHARESAGLMIVLLWLLILLFSSSSLR